MRRRSRSRAGSVDECSLDLFWLEDESLLDADDLGEPDELAQEIVEDLRAAVVQLEGILADLEDAPA
jgi:type I restriction enzyme M protein